MMWRRLLILCLVAIVMPAFATPVSGASLHDVVTPGDHEVLMGDFRQTKVLKNIGAELKSSGSFRFSGASGLLWSTEKPIQSQLKVTQSGVTRLRKGKVIKEISIADSPVVGALASTLYAVFSADESILEKQFETESVARQSGGWELVLKPRGRQMAQIIAGMTIRGDQFVDSVRLTSPDGNVTRIRLENVRIGQQ